MTYLEFSACLPKQIRTRFCRNVVLGTVSDPTRLHSDTDTSISGAFYWEHTREGHAPALMFAIVAIIAALHNPDCTIEQALFTGGIVLVLCYIPILLTNRN